MELSNWEDQRTMERHYHFVLTVSDLVNVRLSEFDREILRRADLPDATIAVKLLALEAIADRIERALSDG